MLRQIEEQEKEQDEKEVVTRDDVEESLKATWQYVRDKEQLLKGMLWFMEVWFAVYTVGIEYFFFHFKQRLNFLLFHRKHKAFLPQN